MGLMTWYDRLIDNGANLSGGFVDGATFGLTYEFRELWGWNATLDTSTGLYKGGAVVGATTTLVVVTYATAGTGTGVAVTAQGAALGGALTSAMGAVGGDGVRVRQTLPGVVGGAVGGHFAVVAMGAIGGAGALPLIGSGIVAGVTGDMAFQATDGAMGNQSQYSWRQTALAGALGGAFSQAAYAVKYIKLDFVSGKTTITIIEAGAAVPEGSFSIVNWEGYPAHLPKPTGPFRLLIGAEYDAARRAANAANRAIHKADPSLTGMQIHEVHPVKFGGSPVDPANKIPLKQPQHTPATTWWNRTQCQIEGL